MTSHVLPPLPSADTVPELALWVVVGGFVVMGLIVLYLLVTSPKDAGGGHRLRSRSDGRDKEDPAAPLRSPDSDRALAPLRDSDARRRRRDEARDDNDGDR